MEDVTTACKYPNAWQKLNNGILFPPSSSLKREIKTPWEAEAKQIQIRI